MATENGRGVPAFMTDEGNRLPTRGTVVSATVLAVLSVAVLAGAWFMNGKGMAWKFGPETMIQIHQASIHFPIGLLLTSAAFEVAALLLRRKDLNAAAFWTLLAGAAGAVGAAGAGLLGNPFATDVSAIGQKVLVHQKVGMVTAVVFVLLALWRVTRRGRTGTGEGLLIALVTLAGVALVSVTGYLGGHLMD